MLVLMDMEWMQNGREFFCPTQLSAIRVDENWEPVDTFSSLIKPFDESCRDWKHCAYAGGTEKDFMSAPIAPPVFIRFMRWLRYDDVLVWWYEQTAATFKVVAGNLLHRDFTYPMRYAYPAWHDTVKDLKDGYATFGSPYTLMSERGWHPVGVKHCAANDVENMRLLLQRSGTPVAAVYDEMLSPNAKALTQKQYQEKVDARLYNNSDYPLAGDKNTQILHVRGCPKIDLENGELRGYTGYKSALRRRYVPCECCEKDFWISNTALVRELVKRRHIHYVYEKERGFFHNPDCPEISRMYFVDVFGSKKYNQCIKQGLAPCPVCNPVPEVKDKDKDPDKDKKKGRKPEKKAGKPEKGARKPGPAPKPQGRPAPAEAQPVQEAAPAPEVKPVPVRKPAEPQFAFFAVTGYQNFHLKGCGKLPRTTEMLSFAKYKDATKAGFKPCKMCKPSAKHDIRDPEPEPEQTAAEGAAPDTQA